MHTGRSGGSEGGVPGQVWAREAQPGAAEGAAADQGGDGQAAGAGAQETGALMVLMGFFLS